MTRDEAVQSLRSGTPHERLKAARWLARNGQTTDLAAIRQARKVETVSYVKTSLDTAIRRLSNVGTARLPDPSGEFDVPDHVKQQIRTRAVEWTAGMILHEVGRHVGRVARAASKEIPNYEASKTRRHLETLQKTYESIRELKSATAVPKPSEFDLASLVAEIVETEAGDAAERVSQVGTKPLLVTSDPTLIRLAVANGLRNAIEAVAGQSNDGHPVVVTWGLTDVDCWVVIIDQGTGIVGPPEAAFAIGSTTKSGHSGFGLAIARQAIETLGGTVSLAPATDGGTRYELRWEK